MRDKEATVIYNNDLSFLLAWDLYGCYCCDEFVYVEILYVLTFFTYCSFCLWNNL